MTVLRDRMVRVHETRVSVLVEQGDALLERMPGEVFRIGKVGGWIVTFVIDKRGGGASAGYMSSGFFGGMLYSLSHPKQGD